MSNLRIESALDAGSPVNQPCDGAMPRIGIAKTVVSEVIYK